MLVVAIVGVLAATVVLGYAGGSERREAQTEAERLALAVELARAEALRRNEIWGLAVEPGGYSFLRYAGLATAADSTPGRSWLDVERRPFGPRQVGADVGVRVARTGGVSPPGAAGSGAVGASRKPTVAIYPSGEMTPFVIVFGAGAGAWLARSDGLAPARAARSDAEAEADGVATLRRQR